MATLREVEGQRCLVADGDGAVISDGNGARDLIEEAMGLRVSVVVVPASGLDDAFFQLKSGLAGEIFQKMVNYRLKFAVIGDVSAWIAASDAFRDLVVECDRGHSVFFCADLDALAARLAAIPEAAS